MSNKMTNNLLNQDPPQWLQPIMGILVMAMFAIIVVLVKYNLSKTFIVLGI